MVWSTVTSGYHRWRVNALVSRYKRPLKIKESPSLVLTAGVKYSSRKIALQTARDGEKTWHMTQLTFSSNFYWNICFKFCILEQIIATVLFLCISSINNKRSSLRFQSTTAPTNRGWSACGFGYKNSECVNINIPSGWVTFIVSISFNKMIRKGRRTHFRTGSWQHFACVCVFFFWRVEGITIERITSRYILVPSIVVTTSTALWLPPRSRESE